jgi:hypothetical protein
MRVGAGACLRCSADAKSSGAIGGGSGPPEAERGGGEKNAQSLFCETPSDAAAAAIEQHMFFCNSCVIN